MIYLVTGAGEPNFGDELIALGWVSYYRDQGYGGPIFVDCKSSVGARKLHGDIEGVQFGRFLKALSLGRNGDIADYISAGRRFVDLQLGYKFNDTSTIAENAQSRLSAEDVPTKLRDTKLIHFVGGGYINGAWPNSFALLGAASQLAKRVGCPIVATGLGTSPVRGLSASEYSFLAEALVDFQMFELRDQKSYDELVSAGVSAGQLLMGYDDCFLHPVQIATNFQGRSLHLSLFEKHLEGSSGEAIINAVESHIDKFDRVLCWQCNPSDKAACDFFEKRFSSVEVKRLYNGRLLKLGLPIGSTDVMITSRFHPHMLAARAGISGYFLSFSNFYDAKHESVLALGSTFKPFNGATEVDFSSLPLSGFEADSDKKYLACKRKVADDIYKLV